MVILLSQNKITHLLMFLAWVWAFNVIQHRISPAQRRQCRGSDGGHLADHCPTCLLNESATANQFIV